MPLLTVARPCGNGTSPLDHATVGCGLPNTRQEREAMEFANTFTTLLGVLRNRGGTRRKKQGNKRINSD